MPFNCFKKHGPHNRALCFQVDGKGDRYAGRWHEGLMTGVSRPPSAARHFSGGSDRDWTRRKARYERKARYRLAVGGALDTPVTIPEPRTLNPKHQTPNYRAGRVDLVGRDAKGCGLQGRVHPNK